MNVIKKNSINIKMYFYSLCYKFQGKIYVQDRPQQKEDVPSTSSMDPGTSLSLSPIRSRTRHTETQTSESSFSTVQDSTLCRFCGEGYQGSLDWVFTCLAAWAGEADMRVLGACFVR